MIAPVATNLFNIMRRMKEAWVPMDTLMTDFFPLSWQLSHQILIYRVIGRGPLDTLQEHIIIVA